MSKCPLLKRPVELSWHTHQTIHWPLMPCVEPSAFIECLKLLICHLPVCRSRFRWTCVDMKYLDMDHPQLFLLKKGFNSGSCMWGIFYGPLPTPRAIHSYIFVGPPHMRVCSVPFTPSGPVPKTDTIFPSRVGFHDNWAPLLISMEKLKHSI